MLPGSVAGEVGTETKPPLSSNPKAGMVHCPADSQCDSHDNGEPDKHRVTAQGVTQQQVSIYDF